MFKKFLTIVAFAALPAGMAYADDHTMEGITGDAEAGEATFKKCMACHAVGEGAKNKIGPHLNGVVGRAVAAGEDFKYSDALIAMGEEGTEWTPENLAAFLENPREFAKGTKMAFPGLRKEEERDNVIAYLAEFSGEEDAAE